MVSVFIVLVPSDSGEGSGAEQDREIFRKVEGGIGFHGGAGGFGQSRQRDGLGVGQAGLRVEAGKQQHLVDQAMEELGRVDVLVNNAGIGTAVPATRETPEQFRQVIDVNLNGCYWMAQACGRVMEPGSSIINISSVLGLTTAGLPQAAYSASKAGLIGLTRDLSQQWTGRKGIRVNALAPGFFESEMTEQYPDGYLDSQMSRNPSGRAGDPRELAATAVYLASPAAGYVTGQTLAVDGGMTILFSRR